VRIYDADPDTPIEGRCGCGEPLTSLNQLREHAAQFDDDVHRQLSGLRMLYLDHAGDEAPC
jgi:hypothetical protein